MLKNREDRTIRKRNFIIGFSQEGVYGLIHREKNFAKEIIFSGIEKGRLVSGISLGFPFAKSIAGESIILNTLRKTFHFRKNVEYAKAFTVRGGFLLGDSRILANVEIQRKTNDKSSDVFKINPGFRIFLKRKEILAISQLGEQFELVGSSFHSVEEINLELLSSGMKINFHGDLQTPHAGVQIICTKEYCCLIPTLLRLGTGGPSSLDFYKGESVNLGFSLEFCRA